MYRLVAAAVILARDVLGALDETTIAGMAAGVADLLLGADLVRHLLVSLIDPDGDRIWHNTVERVC